MKKLLCLSATIAISSCSSLLSVGEADIKASLDRIEAKLQVLEDKIAKVPACTCGMKSSIGEQRPVKKDLTTTKEGLTQINTKAALDKVLSEPGPKVFKFTTDWCAICKTMAKDFAEVAKEFEGEVKAYDIDGDNKELQSFVKEHVIYGYPTVVALPSRKAMVGHSTEVYRRFFERAVRDGKRKRV
jgi:thiol-disulfide isomerase/thioredoxin